MHNTLYLNTSLCYFCNLEDETVTHMFVHCSETKRLWCAILESTLTLIWMGSLRVRFGVRAGLGWGGGGGGESYSLSITRWNYEKKLDIWCISTHTHVVSESIIFSSKNLFILLMSVDFFVAKVVTLLKATA